MRSQATIPTKIQSFHKWLLALTSIVICSVSFAVEPVDVTNIRVGATSELTRIIFDLSAPLSIERKTPLIGNQHELILENVRFIKPIEELDFSDSLLESLQLNIVEKKGKTLANNSFQLSILSKQQTRISIKTLPPSTFYSDRLVLDFVKDKSSIPGSTSVEETLESESLIESKQALSENKYDSAVLLFEGLLNSQDALERQTALEYYGIALDRAGKDARAKRAYQDYLELYPDSESSEQVRQRLLAILTLENETVELKNAKLESEKNQNRFDQYGYFSQAYRYSGSEDDNGDKHTNLSSLYSNVDITGRYRNERFESTLRMNSSYDKNLLSEEGFGNDTSSRFSYLYFQVEDMAADQDLKIGRQRSRNGGVSGRFDGIEVSKELGKARLHLLTGKPVDRSAESLFSDDRYFYAFNVNTSLMDNTLDLNFFALEQRFEGYIDRRALGGEFKYYKPDYNVFGLLDYDIHFSELNAAMLNTYVSFDSGASANLSMSYRKSPYLTTRNALIGQQVDSIEEINNLVTTDEEIEALALDRTFDSRYLSLSYFQPLTERFDLNSSLTLSNLSGSPASGGIAAIESTGTEYYLSSQLIGQSILSEYDLLTLGLNVGELANASQYSGSLQWRYQAIENWRFYPKLVLQMRDYDDDRKQTIINPSLSVDYRFSKNHSLELQTGLYLYDTKNSFGDNEKFQVNFANLSYFFQF